MANTCNRLQFNVDKTVSGIMKAVGYKKKSGFPHLQKAKSALGGWCKEATGINAAGPSLASRYPCDLKVHAVAVWAVVPLMASKLHRRMLVCRNPLFHFPICISTQWIIHLLGAWGIGAAGAVSSRQFAWSKHLGICTIFQFKTSLTWTGNMKTIKIPNQS